MAVGSISLVNVASTNVLGTADKIFVNSNSAVRQVSANGLLFINLPSFANDSAANTGGVVVGQLYRNGSVLMVRVG